MSCTLAIIIVNFNTGDQLKECLRSLDSCRRSEFKLSSVIIVDNHSSDGSFRDLGNFSFPLSLIKNELNTGFAAACNQGASAAEADFFLFLNPDTILLENTLEGILDRVQRADKEKVGIWGVQLVDESGSIARSCARFPTLTTTLIYSVGLNRLWPQLFKAYTMDEWAHTETRPVDHVIGAFYLVRSNLFHRLNGFDERFFVYLEDVDFSYRARSLGYTSEYVVDVRAFHRGGGSSRSVKAARLFYALRSRVIYIRKHYGRVGATLVLACTIFAEGPIRILRSLAIRSRADLKETLSAYLQLCGWARRYHFS